MNTVWIGVAGAGLILGGFFAWQSRGLRKRRLSFETRPTMHSDDWFDNLYPIDPGYRVIAIRVLQALASDIGIEWTRLRPEDSFETTVLIPRKYGTPDDLVELERTLIDLAAEYHVDPHKLPHFSGRIGDFIAAVQSKLAQKVRPMAGQVG